MHAVLTLLLQIGVVLAAARLVGLAFRKLRQPEVIGEAIAGLMLGPSLLGRLAPGLTSALFPEDGMAALQALSQTGLVVFMFLVGVELDPELIRGRGRPALVTGVVSIVVPFALGALLALHLHPRFAASGAPLLDLALFLGAAMSITAFPVLARILAEHDLLRSRLGAVTIACAALDGLIAWCVLAMVVTLVRARAVPAELGLTVGGAAAFAAFMVLVVRRLMARLELAYVNRGRVLSQDMIALFLLLVVAAAWTTERLGIHAIFGAFLSGVVLPKDGRFVRDLTAKLEDLTVVFLLPMFFAFLGLRTRLDLVHGAAMWLDGALILGVAVAGKLGGVALAARASGLSWRESGALGALMNTRGVMALVILALGLDLGILPPALFSLLVAMALANTLLTSPLLEWLYPSGVRALGDRAETEPGDGILIPVSLPSAGPELVRLAAELVPERAGTVIHALHLTRAADHRLLDAPAADAAGSGSAALGPLVRTAADLGLAVRPLELVSHDPDHDIVALAERQRVSLILMGWHKPALSQSILSGPVHGVMRGARCDVAVYVQRGGGPLRRVLVPFEGGEHDRLAVELAMRMARPRPGAEPGAADERRVTVLHVVSSDHPAAPERAWLEAARGQLPEGALTIESAETDAPLERVIAEVQRGYELMIVGVSEELGLEPRMFSSAHERLAAESPASLLIVRKYRRPGASPR